MTDRREYYYHRFYKHQPDLNMDNLEVRREVQRIMGYWLELGVAGFRVDAVPFVIESTVPGKATGATTFRVPCRGYARFLQWRAGDAILLGEANVASQRDPGNTLAQHGDGIHMMFNFYVNQHLFYALATGDTDAAGRGAARDPAALPGLPSGRSSCATTTNSTSDDSTDEQRDQVFARFAPDKDMQLYDRGIRRRLAPMLGDRHHLELAYSLMFSLARHASAALRRRDRHGR